MRNLCCNLSALLLAVLTGACSSGSNQPSHEGDGLKSTMYKLFITSQQRDTDGKNITITDSTIFDAVNDSSAYVHALVKFECYLSDGKVAGDKNGIAPLTFKLITKNNEDIALKLPPLQKASIELTARALVQQENKTVQDSSNNIRNNNIDKTGIKNTLDSIIINKPAGDTPKNYRRKRPSTTYVPI